MALNYFQQPGKTTKIRIFLFSAAKKSFEIISYYFWRLEKPTKNNKTIFYYLWLFLAGFSSHKNNKIIFSGYFPGHQK
jgi:hypothetical protein